MLAIGLSPTMRADLDRLHIITFTGPAGTFRQTTELTQGPTRPAGRSQARPPKKIIELAARF